MWKHLGSLIGMMIVSVAIPAHGEYVLSSGARGDIFTDDQRPATDGFELTMPIGIAYRHARYSISVETAYSHATVHPGADDDAELGGMTDTLLSAMYVHNFPKHRAALIAGLDINLPTGREHLTERERVAEIGESNDLVEVDNFGDGFNVSVSLGFMRDFQKTSLGAQAAYVYKGAYDPTAEQTDDELDPGDQILGVVLGGWQASSRISLDAFVSYSSFLPDTVNAQETFQQGSNVVIGGNFRYKPDPVGLTISLQGTAQTKNSVLIDEALQTEEDKSSGNNLFGLTDLTYQASSKLLLRVLGDVRYYGETELKQKEANLPFKGQRLRYAIGPGAIYAVNKHLSCDGLVKWLIMRQEPDIRQDEDVTYQGVNVDVGCTFTF